MLSDGDLMEAVKKLVDASSVQRVLEQLALVCYAKGEHLRHDWQDGASAKAWDAAARAANAASTKVSV